MMPVRVTVPPLRSVKHGLVVLLLQQSWLRPPFESTQMLVPGLVGSSICETQARPVHGEPHPVALHWSGSGGTPAGSPGFFVQGVGPVSVPDVPR